MLERKGTAKSRLFPLNFSLTTSRQGRPCFYINSRSPAANLSRKSSEIETILMLPAPLLEEARPVSQRTPLHVGDILRLRTPSPPEVIRTRGPYSWSRGPRHPYCTQHAGSPEDVLKHSPISRWNDSLPQEARSTEERRHNSPSRRNRSAKCESGSLCI